MGSRGDGPAAAVGCTRLCRRLVEGSDQTFEIPRDAPGREAVLAADTSGATAATGAIFDSSVDREATPVLGSLGSATSGFSVATTDARGALAVHPETNEQMLRMGVLPPLGLYEVQVEQDAYAMGTSQLKVEWSAEGRVLPHRGSRRRPAKSRRSAGMAEFSPLTRLGAPPVQYVLRVSVDDVETVYVLVDWDNLERSFPGRNNGEEVAYQLRERVAQLSGERFPKAREVEIRCYSAWLAANGSLTSQGRSLRPKIETASQRVNGLPIRLSCVDGMVAQGAPAIFAHLAGPRECRCEARSQVYEQKIVDTMIVADAAALAEYNDIGIVVVGDDIDLAPGLVMAGLQRAFLTNRQSSSSEVIWLRRRPQTRQTRLLGDTATIEEW